MLDGFALASNVKSQRDIAVVYNFKASGYHNALQFSGAVGLILLLAFVGFVLYTGRHFELNQHMLNDKSKLAERRIVGWTGAVLQYLEMYFYAGIARGQTRVFGMKSYTYLTGRSTLYCTIITPIVLACYLLVSWVVIAQLEAFFGELSAAYTDIFGLALSFKGNG